MVPSQASASGAPSDAVPLSPLEGISRCPTPMQEVDETQDTLSSELLVVPDGLAVALSDQPESLQAADSGDSTSEAFVRDPTATQDVADVQDTPAKPAPRAEVCPGPARAIQTPAPATATRAATDTARSARGLTG